MTFVELQNNTLADADVMMDNFRNGNFGGNLIPVNRAGAGVDNTLDLGSGAASFRNAHFSGNVFARDHARASGGAAEFSGETALCPNNAWTPVQFRVVGITGELDRIIVLHSIPKERFDLQLYGVWLISMCVTFVTPDSGSASRRGVGFRVRGTTEVRGINFATFFNEASVQSWALYECDGTTNTDIEMVVFQDSGSPLAIRQSQTLYTPFLMDKEGSTRFEMWRLK